MRSDVLWAVLIISVFGYVVFEPDMDLKLNHFALLCVVLCIWVSRAERRTKGKEKP